MPAAITEAPVEWGVVVTDRERAFAFYGGLLGLPYLGEIVFPLGRIWRFELGASVVKLIQYNDPLEATSPPGELRSSGFRYLTFRVSNIDELIEECLAAGARVPMPVTEAAPGVRFAFLEDPDGARIELVQVDEA